MKPPQAVYAMTTATPYPRPETALSLAADTEPRGLFKRDVFGVQVTAAGPQAVVDQVMAWARRRESRAVDFMPVHGLIEAVRAPEHRRVMNAFDVVACDGQPVRWALNRFHDAGLDERVYGPTTMLRVCERCADEGVRIYLYGGKPEVLDALRKKLSAQMPNLQIAGAESPPFRPLTEEEDRDAVERINASGAGVVFLGLGCPRQEAFAHAHRDRIRGVQLCVGAAFDFHAGAVKQAPAWMQKRGLEWLYRLTREPGRLWKRYLVTNSMFVALFVLRWIRRK